MKFIGYKDIEEYNRLSYVECTCFEVDGTPCTPEFLADMVVNRWMIHTPHHRENIRMRIDKSTSSENSRQNWMGRC